MNIGLMAGPAARFNNLIKTIARRTSYQFREKPNAAVSRFQAAVHDGSWNLWTCHDVRAFTTAASLFGALRAGRSGHCRALAWRSRTGRQPGAADQQRGKPADRGDPRQ